MKKLISAALVAFALATPVAAQQAQPQQQQAQQPPDPARMSRQQLRDEVTHLRGYVMNGGVVPFRPNGCTGEENRQFDFWLGEWDVSPSGVSIPIIIAESTISMNVQGCVMIEYWRPFAGAHGHSINSFDRSDNKWHQTWADATGRRTEYGGTFQDGVMYLDMLNPQPNAQGVVQRQRMNYQALDANTVRQWGETWDEATQAWTVSWDLTYRRRANTSVR